MYLFCLYPYISLGKTMISGPNGSRHTPYLFCSWILHVCKFDLLVFFTFERCCTFEGFLSYLHVAALLYVLSMRQEHVFTVFTCKRYSFSATNKRLCFWGFRLSGMWQKYNWVNSSWHFKRTSILITYCWWPWRYCVLLSIRKHWSNDSTILRRPECSSIPLWKPQVMQCVFLSSTFFCWINCRYFSPEAYVI